MNKHGFEHPSVVQSEALRSKIVSVLEEHTNLFGKPFKGTVYPMRGGKVALSALRLPASDTLHIDILEEVPALTPRTGSETFSLFSKLHLNAKTGEVTDYTRQGGK